MENFQYFLFSQEIRNCLIGVCITLGCLNAFCILTVARTVSQPSTILMCLDLQPSAGRMVLNSEKPTFT